MSGLQSGGILRNISRKSRFFFFISLRFLNINVPRRYKTSSRCPSVNVLLTTEQSITMPESTARAGVATKSIRIRIATVLVVYIRSKRKRRRTANGPPWPRTAFVIRTKPVILNIKLFRLADTRMNNSYVFKSTREKPRPFLYLTTTWIVCPVCVRRATIRLRINVSADSGAIDEREYRK